ncbi:hypothetical protein BD410DRAFT_818788 [Rickenella mellea]|uniref:WD40 repeat-like protein n=1 Tax=Rickenella mellea TaxID=50990 RepID=A0A4Y7QIZ3_9AGAM|nr:hypothetical protein BD410DRAFT_818788 [Rickenella mellea]
MHLRPRQSRPSYTALLDIGEDGEAEQTNPQDVESGSSGDDFKPTKENDAEIELDEVSETDASATDEPAEYVDQPSVLRRKLSGSAHVLPQHKAGPVARKQIVTLAPGLSRPVKRQNYSLPTPSADHRHRSGPLYRHKALVERLASPPKPFSECPIKYTSNWTTDAVVTDRVTKASGYNVGCGPVWEIMEDRSWWKESIPGEEEAKEENRRPKVYEELGTLGFFEALDQETGKPYLPGKVTTESEPNTRDNTVTCHFGRIDAGAPQTMRTFDAVDLSKASPGCKAYVFNAGGPVWGLDWCPIFSKDLPFREYKQYLAVAPFPSQPHSPQIGIKRSRPSPACIQIWSLSRNDSGVMEAQGDASDVEDGIGKVDCEMILCIDSGPAYELKWCPLPTNDSWSDPHSIPRKLGILAGAFEDGSMSIYAVPDPQYPLLRIELEETSIWSLDWANSELIAVGCTNGSIAVYNVKEALSAESHREILPTYYIAVHQAPIRALRWIPAPPVSADGIVQVSQNPCVIVSVGYDGCEFVTDLRDGSGNIMNRTRDVINAVTYSTHAVGPITIDHENTVKNFTISPSMLGRGHTLVEPAGPVWSLHASDYHSQLAVGSADGTLLTTNMLKSTRRGGAVPFFAHKIYQLDHNRKTGEFRMLDHFLPTETQDRPAATRARQKATPGNVESTLVNTIGTGTWPSQIGVLRVCWNTGAGLARAPFLASGTASGLCRIDWLLGRFLREKQPYGGIEGIRKEVEDAMKADGLSD